MNFNEISTAAQNSGGVLYLMVILLFIGLTIAFERTWYVTYLYKKLKKIIKKIRVADTLSKQELDDILLQSRQTPFYTILLSVMHFGRGDRGMLSNQIEEEIMHSSEEIDKRMWALDSVVTLAPLLGLFGTIIGMFNSFKVLAHPGNAPTQVTGGIAEALLSTASGIVVAMICLIFFNGLNNRIDKIYEKLEILKTMLVNKIDMDDTTESVSRG
jgi:biopolymer transport protein ExbB